MTDIAGQTCTCAAASGVIVGGGGYVLNMPADLPRAVEVLHDSRLHPGWVEAIVRDGDGWRAFVRYRIAVGSTLFLQWRDGVEVRRPGE